MKIFNRIMKLDVPAGQSVFLWGARSTGKSTFLRNKFPDSIYIDLLKTDEYTQLMVKPWLLRERLSAENPERLVQPVIIDEVQKIPALLDEVHWLIENKGIAFILCGSSARKLKRSGVNLLGGRAWNYAFYPLVYKEIPDFDLLRAFNHGLLPKYYLTEQIGRALRAYVGIYLKEEIQAESLVRNLPGFAKFLDIAGFCNGELVDYTNIARDCGIDAKTVKAYYQILVDTLVAYAIEPFTHKLKRELIVATPKYYLFDVGVSNYLAKKTITSLNGFDAGNSFEHFILMEIMAYIGMNGLDCTVNFWRTKTQLEVDFVLNNGKVAIEVKLSEDPFAKDLKGLLAFCADYRPKHALVVCNSRYKRRIEIESGVVYDILPWRDFLDNLWAGKYFC